MGRTACTEPQCLYKGALYRYLYLSYSLLRLYSVNNVKRHRSIPVAHWWAEVLLTNTQLRVRNSPCHFLSSCALSFGLLSECGSLDSSVDIVTRLRKGVLGIVVRLPAGPKRLSLLQSVYTGSGTRRTSYSVST